MATIIFDKTFDSGWRKILSQRSTQAQGGKSIDPYLVAPNGKRLRSNVELLNFIVDHPEYWSDFNPKEVNLERSTEEMTEISQGTMKLVKFFDLIASGMDSEEAIAKVCERKALKASSSTSKKTPEKRKKKEEEKVISPFLKIKVKKTKNNQNLVQNDDSDDDDIIIGPYNARLRVV